MKTNQFFKRVLWLLMPLLTIFTTNVWAGNEVYKTALFGSSYNSQGLSSYSNSWYSTNDGFRVDITNANNNNNGWSYIKMGSKNAASVGKITTNAAIDKKVTQVRLTIDAVTTSNINSIKLYKSTNKSTWTELGSYTVGTGAKDVAIAAGNQATNLYYEIRVDCKKSSNGVITISKVEYYIDGVTTTTVLLNKNNGTTNGSAEFSLGESSYNSFTAVVPASCKICTGYWTATSGGNKVLNPDGSFAADNVTGWITNGKWSKDANSATLYAQWRDEIYTVTLKDDDTTLPQGSCGASVTLPSRAGCSGYTFAGWTKSWTEEQDEWTTTAPTIIPAGSYTPTTDENLYPVYTKTESGGGTTTKTYGWEASEPDASSWTISTQPSQSGNQHHTGSYSGYINTNNTYVTFNDKVKVTEFSFYFTRTSNNNNYNVYIETSTDGSSWTAVQTYAMNSFATSVSWSKCSKTWDGSTAYYVRFHCYNTTAVRYVDDISITYTGGTTTSYISVPSCCDKNVTLAHNSPSNGTVTFSPAGPIATCSATAADRQTTMTITPNAGYKLTGWSTTGVTPASVSPAVATSGDESKSAQAITVTFTQNTTTGTYTANATFTAMVDHFIDKLHETTGYTESDNHAESAKYTVPNLSDKSAPSDETCEQLHYKFVGWVAADDVDSDGTLIGSPTILTGGTTNHPASDKTYWAIWAKEL